MLPVAVFVLFFGVVALAQVPPANTPCTTSVSDCCITGIEHVTIDGVTYSHQVCRDRQVASCTSGCSCQGQCSDSSALCSCLDPTPTTTVTASGTPSPSQTPSITPSASETASQTRTASHTAYPSRSLGSSPSSTGTPSQTPPPRSASVTPTRFIHVPSVVAHNQTHAPTRSKTANTHVGVVVSLVVVAACCLCLCLCVVVGLGAGKRVWQRRRAYKSVNPPGDQDGASLAENAASGNDDDRDQ